MNQQNRSFAVLTFVVILGIGAAFAYARFRAGDMLGVGGIGGGAFVLAAVAAAAIQVTELSQFARRRGLSLIINNGELEVHKSSLAARGPHHHEVSLTPRLRHVPEQPGRGCHQHWGMNE
jgi:hypothetical protein